MQHCGLLTDRSSCWKLRANLAFRKTDLFLFGIYLFAKTIRNSRLSVPLSAVKSAKSLWMSSIHAHAARYKAISNPSKDIESLK